MPQVLTSLHFCLLYADVLRVLTRREKSNILKAGWKVMSAVQQMAVCALKSRGNNHCTPSVTIGSRGNRLITRIQTENQLRSLNIKKKKSSHNDKNKASPKKLPQEKIAIFFK